jgi:hypothetical protein
MRLTWGAHTYTTIYIYQSRAESCIILSPLVIRSFFCKSERLEHALFPRRPTDALMCQGCCFFACKAAQRIVCGASTSEPKQTRASHAASHKNRSVQLILRSWRAKKARAEIPPGGEPRPKIEINHCERGRLLRQQFGSSPFARFCRYLILNHPSAPVQPRPPPRTRWPRSFNLRGRL